MRLALHFGSGVGYGPCGAVGDERVESSGFRRKTGVSTPLLYCRASLEKAGGLAVGEQLRTSIFRSAHRGKSFGIIADAEMTNVLPGVLILFAQNIVNRYLTFVVILYFCC